MAAGSIPACAGEPRTVVIADDVERVYPRVCGGTDKTPPGIVKAQGLSPRVRGNRPPARQQRQWWRSIPACAGEPGRRCAGREYPAVYPRVCGGTLALSLFWATYLGLSPRVRGNPSPLLVLGDLFGSIPACAGEPAEMAESIFGWRVYPRVCGGTLLSRQETA